LAQWARRHLAAIAAVAAICTVAVASTWSGAATAGAGWTVAPASGMTNLVDGQRVSVNIKANADVTVQNVQIEECRLGANFVTREDMLAGAGNCPPTAVSSSSSGIVIRSSSSGIIQLVQTPAGATITYRVGTGVVNWQSDAGPSSLTCDETTQCALVVQLRVNGDYEYTSIPLSFASANPIAGCGGAASGSLTSAASDRLSDAWPLWTKQFCAEQKVGAPTGISYTGEGEGVSSFARGDVDLSYSALGYDSKVGLAASVSSPRAAVPIPIAVGAAVLGVGGGSTQSGEKVPYTGVELKASEIAAMLGGGNPWLTRDNLPYAKDILARNPQLKGLLLFSGGGNPNPIAPSSTESVNWLVTHYLETLSPADFIAPRTAPVQQRHAAAALATANPDYQNELNLLLGRPALAKVLDLASNSINTDGPVWVVTDLASAQALGMPPASIENAAGQFVAPTADSITAAVSTMKPDSNGMLVSDPSVTIASSSGTQAAAATTVPYPLTFVEYAMAPAEPLVDTATCTARTGSQALLAAWLNYLLGDGQKTLPDGYAPLPSSLVEQAKAQIAKVGTATVTGTCAGRVSFPGGGGASPGGGGGSGAAGGASTGNNSLSSVPGAINGVPSAAGGAPGAGAAAAKVKDLAAIPAFVSTRQLSSAGIAIALIGIVLVTSLGASLSGNRKLAVAGTSGSSSATIERGTGFLVALWCAVAIAGVGLVVYQLGPLLSSRDQRQLLSSYRTQVARASHETQGLQGVSTSTKAPELGSPVGVMEIGALRLQSVVVEGVSAAQTSEGPGHVPGTAGLGQPGNSVVVGRRNGYGGPFADLSTLRKGDRILVTTTQGQSVYSVASVGNRTIVSTSDSSSSASPLPTTSAPTTTSTTVAKGGAVAATPKKSTATTASAGSSASTPSSGRSITRNALYGPSKGDQLVLVTSASRSPWNTSNATIAVARLVGKPYAPTDQNGRTDAQTGTSGDSGAWAAVVLAVLAYVGCIVGSILMYRRFRFRVAYLLTIAPLVALTVVVGEAISRLLPAWT
jgi:sortase A